MSLWASVQNLPGVRDLYGPHFPLEVRHFFAGWIETQPWCVPFSRYWGLNSSRHTINENDEVMKDVAQGYTDTLLRLMRSKIEEVWHISLPKRPSPRGFS